MTRQLTGPLAGLLTILLIVCPLAAANQDADGETAAADRIHVAPGVYSTSDGSKVTYDASYFTPYQVVTAADMLRWVPGGAALLPSGPGGGSDDDKRGFGSGGDQVLINGKRLSGKSNDIGSAMQRIQADVVSRIELIRGTAAGLDVRSEGTLINIVLSEDVAAGSGAWQLQARVFYNDVEDHIDNVRVTDTVSAAGNIGDASYYGAEFSGSLRLSSIGLDGAVFDASYTLQDSSTTDPFTGSVRKMSGIREREYSLNFRHDIAAWRFNYNIEVDWRGKRYANDINFRETQTAVRPNTHIAMQYRLTDRVLLWFDTRIVFDSHDRRTRERYTGNIADGNLLRYEVRDHHYRREHIIGLRGQF